MADSEVKARRKLEEAEKKCRGGGGFLGKLFGGSGADDAADLFIQSPSVSAASGPSTNETANVEDIGDTTCSSKSASVECDLCFIEFCNIADFESHYLEAHSHQCAACKRMFISEKALAIHTDETHCPFHTLRIERDPAGKHFKCYHEYCNIVFATGTERDRHCREDHNISTIEVILEKRKLARRVCELGNALERLNVMKKKNSVPRSVKFGDQEKAFVGLRNSKLRNRH